MESQSAVEAIESDSSKLPREPCSNLFSERERATHLQIPSVSMRVIVSRRRSKNDDEDVEDVIRLLRGVLTRRREKDEEKQRYVASTPSTITSPASMRKER